MSIQTVRQLLLADPLTISFVGDKIGPLQEIINERPPYIVLKVADSEVFNTLQGFAGLNRTEIELTAWAVNYKQAADVAAAARAALEAAGHFTLREPGDTEAFQQDLVLFAHAYVFQVFDSDD